VKPEACAFCGTARSETSELIAGPVFFICYACVARCESGALPDDTNTELGCDFCRKPRHKVKRFHAGVNARICDLCLDLCSDIVFEMKNR
jgi:ATP-dependent protease Clp ATPase subunit